MSETGTHWARRTLTQYAMLLAGAVVIGIGVFLLFLDDDLGGGEIASAVGLNLIASVVFAGIFSHLSGKVQERLLLERIEGTIGKLSDDLFGKLDGYDERYMPTGTYGAGDRYDKEYNRHVTDSLANTRSYYFRGTSAKYVPARLHRAPRGNLRDVRIIMLDPRNREVLEARAAIKKDQTGSTEKVEDLAAEIKEEILMSVVALYECRNFCSPEIAFVQDVAATRIEMFDDAAYISWYQGPDSANKPFPESLKFARGTFLYEVQSQELLGRYGLANPLKITRSMPESDILQELTELAGRPVTSDDVRRWSEEHARYVADFKRFLERL
ncbi:hypothetical protein ABZ801_04760 [Actinomadura sp. NPDC047616]|uniref:hypothetical protein n=1 Tax=Actinomadura sp. NPDC047616 TaxID=3155914 RepID=UPI0033C034FF